jgi:hypothetical protein
VIERLKTVFDPEIPVNVVDLGLIYVCEAHPLAETGAACPRLPNPAWPVVRRRDDVDRDMSCCDR